MTNRKSFLFILPLIAMVIMACNFGINIQAVRGSGNLKTEERSVSGFDRISLSGMGDLNIVQGDEEALTIEAEDNLLQYITTEVRDSELQIGIKDGANILPTRSIRFELRVKDLTAVSVSGAGNLKMDALRAENLNLTVSGAGNVDIKNLDVTDINVKSSGTGNFNLAGKTQTQNITISGAGNYRAADLESNSADLSVSGAGNSTLWVKEKLTVKISGFGRVEYYGDPTVTQDITGGGSVKSLGSK